MPELLPPVLSLDTLLCLTPSTLLPPPLLASSTPATLVFAPTTSVPQCPAAGRGVPSPTTDTASTDSPTDSPWATRAPLVSMPPTTQSPVPLPCTTTITMDTTTRRGRLMLMLRSSLEVLVTTELVSATTESLPPLPLPPQLLPPPPWSPPLSPSCTTPSSAQPTCPTQCTPWHTLSLARSTRATLVSAPTTSASRFPASQIS